jgi:hypothetical protein
VTEHHCVDTGIELQGIDVREKRVQKIVAEALPLPSIELSPAIKISER